MREETRPDETLSEFRSPEADGLETEAAAALKRIARDENLKAYVQEEKPVHDALLGAALRFIGGESLEERTAVAGRLNQRGPAVTIDYMGKSTRDEEAANEATTEFMRAVEAISKRRLDSSVSLDLSHIGLVVDRELAFANASALAKKARDAGLEVMVSMEGSERTDEILGMYRRLSERFENLGITLQAHLRRTPEDLQDALTKPGKVRLVKGAFEEPEEVAIPRGPELEAVYRALLEEALTSGHPVSIATHDPQILEHAHRFTEGNGLKTQAA